MTVSPSPSRTRAGTAHGDLISPLPEEDLPEYVAWEDGLGDSFFQSWGYPGGVYDPEHVTVYGPSGSGKTYFVTFIMTTRANLRGTHAVVIATKKADKTLTTAGWPVIDRWPPDYGDNQVIYWTRGGLNQESRDEQRSRVVRLADTLWVPDSNIMVGWDELPYVCGDLGLNREVGTYYREGRGNGITDVAALQRPSDGVNRNVHSNTHWTGAFQPADEDDAKRVAELFGNRRYYTRVLLQLNRDKHELLLKHHLTGQCYRTSLPGTRPHLIKRENHPR
jgi:hypothetical protein